MADIDTTTSPQPENIASNLNGIQGGLETFAEKGHTPSGSVSSECAVAEKQYSPDGNKSNEGDLSTTPQIAEEREASPQEEAQTSTETTGAIHATTSASGTGSASQPKKHFTSVNINKRFLEKHSSPSASAAPGGVALSASSSKLNSVAARPTPQAPLAPSRLVTAKLSSASNPQTQALGWSRPSTTTPPASNGMISPINLAQPPSGNLQPPNAPRSRSTSRAGINDRAPSLSPALSQQKPVWGRVSNAAGPGKPVIDVRNDFPTAAEAAIGRRAKLLQSQVAAEAIAAQKQAMLQTADSFRGVHLDPNAHHWDEIEDEDADFLGDVIDFGDGRQYKIQAEEELDAERQEAGSVKPASHRPTSDRLSKMEQPTRAVSKEERFAEDIDRSWPRNQPTTMPKLTTEERPASSASVSTRDSVSLHSPDKLHPRALFNERSNKLEPWGNRSSHTQSPHFSTAVRRDANGTSLEGPDSRIQVLQKAPGTSQHSHESPREGRPIANGHSGSTRMPGRQDPPSERDSKVTPWRQESKHVDGNVQRPAKIASSVAMPPPVIPERSKESPWPSKTSVNQETGERHKPSFPPPQSIGASSPRTRNLSVSSFEAAPPVESATEVTSSAPPVHSEEVVKATMATAAERAKKRRLEEETEREAQKERARKKAAQLEIKMKAEQKPADSKPSEPPDVSISSKAPALSQEDKGERTAEVDESLKHTDNATWRSRRADIVQPNNSVSRPAFGPLKTGPTQQSLRKDGSADVSKDATPQSQSTHSRQASWRKPAGTSTVLTPSTQPHHTDGMVSKSGSASRPQTDKQPSSANQPVISGSPPLDLLTLHPDEEVDVIHFLDLGKLVGATDGNFGGQSSAGNGIPPRKKRPVASDFFTDPPKNNELSPTAPEDDVLSWRRNAPMTSDSASKRFGDTPIQTAFNFQSTQIARTEPSRPLPRQSSPEHGRSPSVSKPDGLSGISPSSEQRSSLPSDSHHDTNLSGFDGAQVNADYHKGLGNSSISSRSARPPTGHWKEGSLSALDDTMSRIKGALDGLQAKEPLHELKVTSVTVPSKPLDATSQLKQSPLTHIGYRHGRPTSSEVQLPVAPQPVKRPLHREVFDITGVDPPRSPKPAWNAFSIKLPRVKRPFIEPLTKKQRHYVQIPIGTVNWDIVTFVPVDGHAKKDLSRDGILFQRFGKSKWRTRVSIPQRRLINSNVDRRSAEAPKPLSATYISLLQPGTPTARVHLPPSALSLQPKPRTWTLRRGIASESDSWRKPRTPSQYQSVTSWGDNVDDLDQILDTVSRSPPPDLFLPPATSLPKVEPFTMDVQESVRSQRRKIDPKLPPGESIGFAVRQISRSVRDGSMVSFTVNSELDSTTIVSVSSDKHDDVPRDSGLVISASTQSAPSQADSVYSKATSTDSFAEHPSKISSTLVTPEMHPSSALPLPSTPWGKSPLAFPVLDSPAKPAPDSDHIKAVWMQTSDKSSLPASNSLKSIADDLTAIPFTLQEVKSEDGSTPPPQMGHAPPSRLEVTRGFQQVPQISATAPESSFPGVILSPGRQTNFRPPILASQSASSLSTMPPYSSPMLAHSPSPTLMYAQHMQPMQHIWPAGAPNRPGTFVRTPGHSPYLVASPAHPQYITYGAHNPTLSGLYHGPSVPQPGGHLQGAGRGRGMAVMGPVVARPAMQIPASGTHGYNPSAQPMFSVPGRTAYDSASAPSYPQQMSQSQSHSGLYNPVPAASFVRPW